MLKALVVRGRFFWGYSIKRPLVSAAQPALKVPPPTTLVGALAYACGGSAESEEGDGGIFSSARGILRKVQWAAFGFDERVDQLALGLLEVSDMARALVAPYLRPEHRESIQFAAQAFGKIYAPGMAAKIVYFGEAVDSLRDCAHSIVRLGSKESLFHVDEVNLERVSRAKGDEVVTSIYVRADAATPESMTDVEQVKVWPLEEDVFQLWRGSAGGDLVLYVPKYLAPVRYTAKNPVVFGDETYAL